MEAVQGNNHVNADQTEVKNEQLQSTKCYLLKIPVEMRLEIYKYLLVPVKQTRRYTLALESISGPVTLSKYTGLPREDIPEDDSVHPQILATCRQLLCEAQPVLYSSITFSLRTWRDAISTSFVDFPFHAVKFIKKICIPSRRTMVFVGHHHSTILPALQEISIRVDMSFEMAWHKWKKGELINDEDLQCSFGEDMQQGMLLPGLDAVFAWRNFDDARIKRVVVEFDVRRQFAATDGMWTRQLSYSILRPRHSEIFINSYTCFQKERKHIQFIRQVMGQLEAFPGRRVVWRYEANPAFHFGFSSRLRMICDNREKGDENLCEVYNGVTNTSRFEAWE
ncbi:hypothetical protein BT63DRAFT_98330 [Microthyrium microscopicum]|uniref:Uncharacterized protein n=1 Tax=Microthyrium microscopicum TaxID=703497 RepID=A0A6A6TYL6_9PEZI|nr:hypothetical protein BT63DRAFT_98330 [Microthyrium microscopicum]